MDLVLPLLVSGPNPTYTKDFLLATIKVQVHELLGITQRALLDAISHAIPALFTRNTSWEISVICGDKTVAITQGGAMATTVLTSIGLFAIATHGMFLPIVYVRVNNMVPTDLVVEPMIHPVGALTFVCALDAPLGHAQGWIQLVTAPCTSRDIALGHAALRSHVEALFAALPPNRNRLLRLGDSGTPFDFQGAFSIQQSLDTTTGMVDVHVENTGVGGRVVTATAKLQHVRVPAPGILTYLYSLLRLKKGQTRNGGTPKDLLPVLLNTRQRPVPPMPAAYLIKRSEAIPKVQPLTSGAHLDLSLVLDLYRHGREGTKLPRIPLNAIWGPCPGTTNQPDHRVVAAVLVLFCGIQPPRHTAFSVPVPTVGGKTLATSLRAPSDTLEPTTPTSWAAATKLVTVAAYLWHVYGLTVPGRTPPANTPRLWVTLDSTQPLMGMLLDTLGNDKVPDVRLANLARNVFAFFRSKLMEVVTHWTNAPSDVIPETIMALLPLSLLFVAPDGTAVATLDTQGANMTRFAKYSATKRQTETLTRTLSFLQWCVLHWEKGGVEVTPPGRPPLYHISTLPRGQCSLKDVDLRCILSLADFAVTLPRGPPPPSLDAYQPSAPPTNASEALFARCANALGAVSDLPWAAGNTRVVFPVARNPDAPPFPVANAMRVLNKPVPDIAKVVDPTHLTTVATIANRVHGVLEKADHAHGEPYVVICTFTMSVSETSPDPGSGPGPLKVGDSVFTKQRITAVDSVGIISTHECQPLGLLAPGATRSHSATFVFGGFLSPSTNPAAASSVTWTHGTKPFTLTSSAVAKATPGALTKLGCTPLGNLRLNFTTSTLNQPMCVWEAYRDTRAVPLTEPLFSMGLTFSTWRNNVFFTQTHPEVVL